MLVYVRDMINNEIMCLTNRPGWYIPGYWSPDSKKINCSQLDTLTNYNIWLLDIEKKEMMCIKPAEEKSRYVAGPWLPNGKGFYVITDLKREYAGLALYDINNSILEWILTPEYDIESVDLSGDGKVLAWTENIDGYSNINVKNLQNGETQEILNLSNKCVIEGLKISPDEKRIGVMMSTPSSPSSIYVVDIESKSVERLTESLMGSIPKEKMIAPELIKYKSFDGLEIPAFFYRPRNANNSSNKFGAILSIHGGPTAQERPTYPYAALY
jgi:dipeptidyl aminopeptidase/acylaminoacyl peptidase